VAPAQQSAQALQLVQLAAQALAASSLSVQVRSRRRPLQAWLLRPSSAQASLPTSPRTIATTQLAQHRRAPLPRVQQPSLSCSKSTRSRSASPTTIVLARSAPFTTTHS
jgi:hypothetical protein